jgi:hypothetical protein
MSRHSSGISSNLFNQLIKLLGELLEVRQIMVLYFYLTKDTRRKKIFNCYQDGLESVSGQLLMKIRIKTLKSSFINKNGYVEMDNLKIN